MKICSSCKSVNSDNAKFCQSCGSTRFQTSDKEQGYFQPEQVMSVSPNEKVLSSNPAINILKNFGTGKLFISAVLCLTVMIIINVIYGIATSFISGNASILLTVVLLYVPYILLCIGLWMYYSTCRASSGASINTFCFKILKISMIFFIVFYCIYYVYLEITLSVSDVSLIITNVNSRTVMPLFFVIGFYAIFLFIYLIKLIKSLKVIKNIAETGYPVECLSNYIIVFNYIIAFSSVFSLLLNGIFGLFTMIFQIAFLVLLTMGLYMLRKDMKNLIFRISVNPEIGRDCINVENGINNF